MAEQSEELQKIHEEAINRFLNVEEREQRSLAIEDMRFAHVDGAQWDDDATVKRANRPRFSINRIEPAIDQITGDQRQNRPSIKARPVSNGATQDIANVYNGLIRNIESVSKAENAYDSAFDEQVTCGYGGWRVITEFNDDDSFDQDIRIMPINSAASSLYFGPSKEYDKRDAMYAFVVTNMPKHEFEEQYPEADSSQWPQTRLTYHFNCRSWWKQDFIKIAEYWKKEPIKKTIGKLSDGRVIDLEDESDILDELTLKGITVLKTRTVDSFKVVRYVMNGNEILEGPKEWAGKYIPLIPVFGKIHHIEGETFIKGVTRNAKDPQKIYNYETSQAIETSALTPKDPYWYTPAMAAGHEAKWKSFPTKNTPFMPYNPDPEAGSGPPMRTGAPSVQQASLATISQAAADIESTTGIYAASLGNAPQLLSEKSVQSQAEKGDRGAFLYIDNLNKSIQYTGEILIDLIPKIYDTERTIRVLNPDGTSEQIEINKVIDEVTDEQTGNKNVVNDLTAGKYDVVTDVGPSYATKRQETAAQMIELSANPVIAQLGLDILVSNLDINESDELTKRVRKQMIGQGIVEPTEEEIEELGLNQPQQPDPTQVALIQNLAADTAEKQANAANKQADTLSKQVNAQKTTAETLDTLVQTMLDKIDKGIPLTSQEVDIAIKQRDIVAQGQQAIDPGPNSLQRQDLVNILNSLRQ